MQSRKLADGEDCEDGEGEGVDCGQGAGCDREDGEGVLEGARVSLDLFVSLSSWLNEQKYAKNIRHWLYWLLSG